MFKLKLMVIDRLINSLPNAGSEKISGNHCNMPACPACKCMLAVKHSYFELSLQIYIRNYLTPAAINSEPNAVSKAFFF